MHIYALSQGVSSSSLKGLTQQHAGLSFETLCPILGCGEERNEKVNQSVLLEGPFLVSARKPNLAFGFYLSSVHNCQLLEDDLEPHHTLRHMLDTFLATV